VFILGNSHSKKRESKIGRWAPFGFYFANIITWLGIGLAAGAWDLLSLALLPVLALTLYVVRSRKDSNEP
jgi:hypothetical protein